MWRGEGGSCFTCLDATLGLRPRGVKEAIPQDDLRAGVGFLGAAPANRGPFCFSYYLTSAGQL